mgnify:CR=1 FL=1
MNYNFYSLVINSPDRPGKDKYYVLEVFNTENVQKNLKNESVVKDIKDNLESLNKRKSMSEIIGKITTRITSITAGRTR